MNNARNSLRLLFNHYSRGVIVVICRPLLVVIAALVAAPTVAHHSFSAFDMEKAVTIEGVILSYQLINPHAHLTVAVPPGAKDSASVGIWDIEGAAANIMRRQGWNAQTFKRGDRIKLVGHPLKSGDRGISLFYVIKPDGSHLYQDIARPKPAAK
jgi:hypothetical protein